MVYVFFANGFEEIEAVTIVDILRRAEIEVKSVGVNHRTVIGAHGMQFFTDLEDSDIESDKLEMVVLPGGGPGTKNLEAAQTVQSTLDYAAKKDLWIAALCAAPSILGHKGLLDGKKATCYPGMEGELGGAKHTGSPVEVDGKIITGRGPGSAAAFALKLVECLEGAAAAKAVSDALR